MEVNDWTADALDESNRNSIAAMVTAVAIETNALNSFQFIQELGLYYDRNSGYFYCSSRQEYFHSHSGYCYSYNADSGENEWNYQPNWAELVGCSISPGVYELVQDLIEYVGSENFVHVDNRLVQSYDDLSYTCEEDGLQALVDESSIKPCIRMVVEQSDGRDVEKFYIITVMGADVGGDPSNDVCIQDEGVSDKHCRIDYDDEGAHYTLNSFSELCWLNETPVEVDSTVNLSHGDLVRLANVHLRLHIHRGTNTCAQCEPGLIITSEITEESSATTNRSEGGSLESRRRKELRALKKRFALRDDPEPKGKSQYLDRAKIRRRFVGSDNPYQAETVERGATVDEHVGEGNKGFKLLSKMGWKQGTGLGKLGSGIKEPVQLKSYANQAGLGSSKSIQCASRAEYQKLTRLNKVKERYMNTDQS